MNQETAIALANLEWLQEHYFARLDVSSGAVIVDQTEPICLISDLVFEGLTPATRPRVFAIPSPESLIGKVVKLRVLRDGENNAS